MKFSDTFKSSLDSDDLNNLFEELFASEEIDKGELNELFDEYSVIVYETTYSNSLKNRILMKMHN